MLVLVPESAWDSVGVRNVAAASSVFESWSGNAGDLGSILGQKNPLEEGMATHSSVPAWRIPWTEEPGGLQSRGSQRVRQDWVIKHSTYILYISAIR